MKEFITYIIIAAAIFTILIWLKNDGYIKDIPIYAAIAIGITVAVVSFALTKILCNWN